MIKSLYVRYRVTVTVEEIIEDPHGFVKTHPVIGKEVEVRLNKIDLIRGEIAASMHTRGPVKQAIEMISENALPFVVAHAYEAAKS